MTEAALEHLIRARALLTPPEPAASEGQRHAEALRAQHAGTAAVLMYGSSLRDGAVEERVLDFYVLVDRIGGAYRSALPRVLGALDQPNVHYLPPGGGRSAPAKYAVMELRAFARRAGSGGRASYIWGRFAQPSWLVWSRDADAEAAVLAALAEAARTMLTETVPLLPPSADAEALWTSAFAESYRSEPRAEPEGKARELYLANAAYYDAVAAALLAEGLASPTPDAARRAWARRRVWGKAAAVTRIFKSALTFEGGLDYAIWKIGRHSGAQTQAPRSRLSKIATLWRLIRSRAIR